MSQFANALKTFPELETARLRLRQCCDADAAEHVRCFKQFPRNSSWIGGYEAASIPKAQLIIRSRNNQYRRAKTLIPWAIVNRNDRQVGFIKLFEITNRSRAEVGYWIAKRHWNKGYASETLIEVRRFAFEVLGLHRLFATTDPTNVGSQRVLEKAGFQREGVLRSHTLRAESWNDSIVYGMLKADVEQA